MLYAPPGSPDAKVQYKARYDNFIGGKFVPPVKGAYFDVLTPITGKAYTQAARSTAEDIELALDAAHAAAAQWGRTPAGERKLTTKESELLRLLCTNRNDVLERSAALIEVWGNDSYFNGRSMDVYIAKLRKYLRDDPAVEIINVHGKGFRLIAKEG